ncbi:hypothetical protein LIA77_10836 [Sarocladium implicatum]|nr:hypothetical protein LIA77_10836 [Sarocladium implicatum]
MSSSPPRSRKRGRQPGWRKPKVRLPPSRRSTRQANDSTSSSSGEDLQAFLDRQLPLDRAWDQPTQAAWQSIKDRHQLSSSKLAVHTRMWKMCVRFNSVPMDIVGTSHNTVFAASDSAGDLAWSKQFYENITKLICHPAFNVHPATPPSEVLGVLIAYAAILRQDIRGPWNIGLRELDGVVSHGASIRTVHQRIRASIADWPIFPQVFTALEEAIPGSEAISHLERNKAIQVCNADLSTLISAFNSLKSSAGEPLHVSINDNFQTVSSLKTSSDPPSKGSLRGYYEQMMLREIYTAAQPAAPRTRMVSPPRTQAPLQTEAPRADAAGPSRPRPGPPRPVSISSSDSSSDEIPQDVPDPFQSSPPYRRPAPPIAPKDEEMLDQDETAYMSDGWDANVAAAITAPTATAAMTILTATPTAAITTSTATSTATVTATATRDIDKRENNPIEDSRPVGEAPRESDDEWEDEPMEGSHPVSEAPRESDDEWEDEPMEGIHLDQQPSRSDHEATPEPRPRQRTPQAQFDLVSLLSSPSLTGPEATSYRTNVDLGQQADGIQPPLSWPAQLAWRTSSNPPQSLPARSQGVKAVQADASCSKVAPRKTF